MMDENFLDLKLKSILIYVNNKKVFYWIFIDHLEHLKQVFQRLCKKVLKLKPSKCFFFCEKLKFLGHIISASGISPISTKVKVITNLLLPKDKIGTEVFLEMAGYYRRFIPAFLEVAQPLFFCWKRMVLLSGPQSVPAPLSP